MTGLGRPGDFCPNEECDDYGKTEANNIVKFGKTKTGVQRFQCKSCGGTFTETRGTLF